MTTRAFTATLFTLLVGAPSLARSQANDPTYDPGTAAPDGSWAQYAPSGAQPDAPAAVPGLPAEPGVDAQAAPAGQWVHTRQYGWIWMPYGESYTSVPASGYGEPYQYVYYPAYRAWTWIVAPWVWGIGPWPYFGAYGPVRFAWYGHGWWRTPSRWSFAPRGHGGGLGPPGFRPAPYRGVVAPHVMPWRGGFGAPARVGVGPARGSGGGRAWGGGGHGWHR